MLGRRSTPCNQHTVVHRLDDGWDGGEGDGAEGDEALDSERAEGDRGLRSLPGSKNQRSPANKQRNQ